MEGVTDSALLIVIPLLAAACAAGSHLAALRLFPRWGLLDFPERYGLQRGRLPYPTGIIAVITFLAFFLALEPFTPKAAGLAAAIAILGASSFLDDRAPLPPLLRLGVQATAGSLVFLSGTHIYTLTNPLPSLGGEVISLDILSPVVPGIGSVPVLSGIFTVFWLGLTINALNWFDGIPGQVSTLSTIGFLTIGFLSLSERVGQPQLALLAFVLAGIAAASLLFDFPPPKVVVGDTGAMFFGLMLGVLTIYAGGKVATAFLVLGVPLIDLFLVVLRRVMKRRSPLKGSARGEHLHHRLLARGWNPRSVILLTAGIGTVFGSAAIFMDTYQKFLAGLALLALMVLLTIYSRPRQTDSVRGL